MYKQCKKLPQYDKISDGQEARKYPLPTELSNEDLATKFSNFFISDFH